MYNELKQDLNSIEETRIKNDMPVSDEGIKELLSQKANKESVA